MFDIPDEFFTKPSVFGKFRLWRLLKNVADVHMHAWYKYQIVIKDALKKIWKPYVHAHAHIVC